MSGSKKLKMWPTDDRRIPEFINISSSDWCVCGAPSWLNRRSPTRSHSRQHTIHGLVSMHACQLNWCLKFSFLQPPYTSLIPNLMWKFFQQLLCYVFFKQKQIFNQNVVFWIAVLKHSSDVISTIRIHHFHYPEKLQSKVSKRELWCEVKSAFRSQHYQDIPGLL